MKRNLLIAVLVLTLCVVVFAACNKTKEPTHLDPVNPDSIAYDGDTLSWGAVDHAESYWVYLDNNENYYVAQENSMNLRLSQDVTFYVLAVANNADYISAETKSAASFTYIPMIESIGVEKRTTDKLVGQNAEEYQSSFDHFTWQAVEKAEYYSLKENGATETVSYKPDQNTGVLKQPIGATFDEKGGKASLQIMPMSDEPRTYSHWSEVKTVTVLADPSKFAYNREADLISWSPIANTLGYEVKVGVDPASIEEWRYISGNYYVYGEVDANGNLVNSFKSWVKAVGNIENDILDSRLVTRSYQQLAPLDGLTVEFGDIKWTPSPVATEYQVRVSVQRVDENDQEYTQNLVDTVVTESLYSGDYEAFYNERTLGGNKSYVPCTYTAFVRPVIASSEAEDVVSYANWSTIDYNLLETPQIDYSGNETFTWNSITGAATYNVWLYRNGVNIVNGTRTEDNQLLFNYNFSAVPGTYELKVAALSGDETASSGTNASRKSEAFVVVVVAAPTEYTIISSTYDVQSGASQTEDGKSELNIFFNDVYGADYYVASHYYDYKYVDTDGDGEYDVVTDGQDSSTKLVRQSINVADTTGDDVSKGKHDVNINSIIADETGRTDTVYLYAKSSLVGKYVEYVKLTDNTYGFREAEGKTKMIVLDGDDSTPVEITKLPTPTDTAVNGNVVSWARVSRSSGYSVKVVCTTNEEYSFVQKVYSDRYTLKIKEAGEYNIYVKALGNGDIILDSIYGSPISVIKLPAVEGLKVIDAAGNTQLTWDESSFTYKGVEYSAKGYEVRIGNRVLPRVENNFVNLEQYKQFLTTVGTAITVTALGDNTTEGEDNKILLDAERSSTITLFKLARPLNVTVQSNMITWGAGDNNAQLYKIYDGDTLIGETAATTFAITPENGFTKDKYADGKQLNLTVVALRNANEYKKVDSIEDNGYFVDSEASVMTTVNMLAMPKVTVKQDTGAATWRKVVGATSYLVKVSVVGVDGSSMNYNVSDITDADELSFTPSILAQDGETVRISVTAIGNNLRYFNSLSYYYDTKVEQLSTPALNDESKPFTVTVNKNTDGVPTSVTIHVSDADKDETERTLGRGYYVNVGGVDHFVSKESGDLTIENLEVATYLIKVCAAGGNYKGEVVDQGDTNVVYLNSPYIGGYTFTVLGAPIASDVDVSYGGLGDLNKRVVSFAAIPQAVGYKLDYVYRKLKVATDITEEAQYVDGQTGSITLTVGSNTANAWVDDEGTVRFVLDGIDNDVDNIRLIVSVLGDDVNSTSNTSTVVSYDVR